MSIQELSSKFKAFLTNSDFLLVIIIAVTGVGGYVLGSSSQDVTQNTPPIEHASRNQAANIQESSNERTEEVTDTQYVASKNGSKYHLLWCPGAKQMKEENMIYFETKEEAEKAGYTPAANCKGI